MDTFELMYVMKLIELEEEQKRIQYNTSPSSNSCPSSPLPPLPPLPPSPYTSIPLLPPLSTSSEGYQGYQQQQGDTLSDLSPPSPPPTILSAAAHIELIPLSPSSQANHEEESQEKREDKEKGATDCDSSATPTNMFDKLDSTASVTISSLVSYMKSLLSEHHILIQEQSRIKQNYITIQSPSCPAQPIFQLPPSPIEPVEFHSLPLHSTFSTRTTQQNTPISDVTPTKTEHTQEDHSPYIDAQDCMDELLHPSSSPDLSVLCDHIRAIKLSNQSLRVNIQKEIEEEMQKSMILNASSVDESNAPSPPSPPPASSFLDSFDPHIETTQIQPGIQQEEKNEIREQSDTPEDVEANIDSTPPLSCPSSSSPLPCSPLPSILSTHQQEDKQEEREDVQTPAGNYGQQYAQTPFDLPSFSPPTLCLHSTPVSSSFSFDADLLMTPIKVQLGHLQTQTGQLRNTVFKWICVCSFVLFLLFSLFFFLLFDSDTLLPTLTYYLYPSPIQYIQFQPYAENEIPRTATTYGYGRRDLPY